VTAARRKFSNRPPNLDTFGASLEQVRRSPSSPRTTGWKPSRRNRNPRPGWRRGAACRVLAFPAGRRPDCGMALAKIGRRRQTSWRGLARSPPTHPLPTMKMLRGLSLLLFLAASAGIIALLFSDVSRSFRITTFHQRAGALALILVGTSYISLQLSANWRWKEKLKGIFLGLAFALWGSEQFLPPSRMVTVIDSMVITIFVVDLGMIILDHLRRDDQPAP
jgi:hypothetical protein